MGFRTIVIQNRSKLDLKMNYLVCRGENEIKVYIPEISYLILESTAISLTTALLSELIKNNVKVIFCDEKHSPESELIGIYGNYNCVSKLKSQIFWKEDIKSWVWQEIIKNKIYQQSLFLNELNCKQEFELLNNYYQNVELNDITNREGHSAKVYFNAVFGNEFYRRVEGNINRALNYGYSLLLSCFNREIVKQGYSTQLGIWHKNEFNYFNLSSDFMEPFRIIVDRIVFEILIQNADFKEYKLQLLKIFNLQLLIDGKKQFLENAISIYCQSIFDNLNNNLRNKIKFYELQNYENDNIF